MIHFYLRKALKADVISLVLVLEEEDLHPHHSAATSLLSTLKIQYILYLQVLSLCSNYFPLWDSKSYSDSDNNHTAAPALPPMDKQE